MAIHVRSKEKEIGATVKGSFARIDKGVASGFSRGNYLKLPETFNPDSNTWEAMIKFETLSNFSAQQIILHPASSSGLNVALVIDTTGKILSYASTNGSSWNILNSTTGTTILSPLTSYYIKMQYTGTAYEVYLSTDGNTFNLELSVSSSSFVKGGFYLTLGAWASDERHAKSIDLSQSYIKINNELWWSGDTYTKVGSWIDDTVVSGFSASNYAELPEIFDTGDNPWEVMFKVKTGTTLSSNENILGDGVGAPYNGLYIIIYNGKWGLGISSNGASWDIADASRNIGQVSAVANTNYYLKASWDGSQYKLDVSTDGLSYQNSVTVNSITKKVAKLQSIGCSAYNNGYQFTGSIDLSGCYININGSRWWHGYDYAPVLLKDVYKSTERKYYKYSTEPNATVVGSPTIENGVASGFTSANYLKVPDNFTPSSNTWEMKLKFTTSSVVTGTQAIISKGETSSTNGIIFMVREGKFRFYAGSGTGAWNIVNGVDGTHSVLTNYLYYVKIIFNGSSYVVSYSMDDEDYVEDIEVSSSASVTSNSYSIGSQVGVDVFSGAIDLTKSYIKINGETWWHGTKAYEVNLGGADVYEDWTQPVLTANGTMGGDSFAVSASSYYDSGSQAWYAFDGNTTDANKWYSAVNGEKWLAFYNPIALNVTSLTVYNHIDARWYLGGGTVQASADGITWENLTTFTQSGRVDSFVIDLGFNKKSYKYYRLNNLIGIGSNGEVWIREIKITAQQLVKVGSDSYDYSDVLKKRIIAAYKTGKKVYYKDGVEVPVESITDFGSTKYYKNIVTTKYWKEITTGSRELEYACYAYNNTYNYVKAPLGSDMRPYIANGSIFNKASSSSELSSPSALDNLKNITEESIEGMWSVVYIRSYEDDLYKDTTVTETVEGTPEDYTYTTEEIVPVEVTNNDDYDYTEFVPSTQFDSSETPSQLVYNLKYDLINPADWQAIGTISGHNFFGAGTFSEYISATREGAVTFNTPLPSGKYTWRFLHYSQVNHTFGTYKITAMYEDGTTEVVYDSGLGDTAYGGGEKATIDLSLTFKKPVKVLTNYTNSWGSGSGCYGGSGNVQLFFDGSKQ